MLHAEVNPVGATLGGSRSDLVSLAERLMSRADCRLALDSERGPSPEDRRLTAVVILVRPSATVAIRVEGEELRVEGGPDGLECLAEGITFLCQDRSPRASRHLHIEWHPEHFYLDPASLPLVVKLDDEPVQSSTDRRELWIAMSSLWLDTELADETVLEIARVVRQSGLSREELEDVFRHELAPFLGPNLRAVAGEWSGFDPEWVCEKALELHRKRRLHDRITSSIGLTTNAARPVWERVLDQAFSRDASE